MSTQQAELHKGKRTYRNMSKRNAMRIKTTKNMRATADAENTAIIVPIRQHETFPRIRDRPAGRRITKTTKLMPEQ